MGNISIDSVRNSAGFRCSAGISLYSALTGTIEGLNCGRKTMQQFKDNYAPRETSYSNLFESWRREVLSKITKNDRRIGPRGKVYTPGRS